jgi:predicted phage terminase large subunit-like protein
MTRWHKRDLTGQLLKSSIQRTGVDEWRVIEFPAIMESGSPLWPEFWSLQELEKLRAELPVSKWSAQYQQDPTSEEGAIIKREWWKIWEGEKPPKCEFVIQSWDTAFLKSERADYSACTTWGVFYKDDEKTGKQSTNIVLLDAIKDRMEFPELKKRAFDEWSRWKPDAFIVEGKAAGMPLIFELRAMGIPVQEFTPSRGNDKVVRVNAVADLFSSGNIWRPARRFAEEVVEEFASFPSGDHDDLVDSSTQALLRFRQGGFIPIGSDEEEERFFPVRADYY